MNDMLGAPEENSPASEQAQSSSQAISGVEKHDQRSIGGTSHEEPKGKSEPAKTAQWKKMRVTDWVTAAATVFIAIATIAYVHYAKKQWIAMRGQESATQNQLTAMNNELAQMKTQSTLAQKQIEAANANAKTSLEATINQFHLEQRAWVGPIEVANVRLEVGKPADISIIVQNTGKTPALHMHSFMRGTSVLKGAPLEFNFVNPRGLMSDSTIEPGAKVVLENNTGLPVTQSLVDAIKNGQITAYFFGRIVYQDVFGSVHHTTYCYVILNDLRIADTCHEYNVAD